jgi:hypothetical protein
MAYRVEVHVEFVVFLREPLIGLRAAVGIEASSSVGDQCEALAPSDGAHAARG